MEPKEKLNQDYINFNKAIEQRAQAEIQKILAAVDALKVQAAKVAKQ